MCFAYIYFLIISLNVQLALESGLLAKIFYVIPLFRLSQSTVCKWQYCMQTICQSNSEFLPELSPRKKVTVKWWEMNGRGKCLPLKSFMLWPNHMLSLLSFRRAALFIKVLDGYLSQHCRRHPQKLPSPSPIPFPKCFFSSTLQCWTPLPTPNPSIPLVLNPSIPPFSLPSSIKTTNPFRFFSSLCYVWLQYCQGRWNKRDSDSSQP